MVRHVVMWQLKDEIDGEEKDKILENIKIYIEDLRYSIGGIVEISVQTFGLPSSNADVMLNALFVDREALDFYLEHNEHIRVAEKYVMPYVKNKVFMDFIV